MRCKVKKMAAKFKVFINYGMLMFSTALEEMSGCVPNIICIAQITLCRI